MSLTRWEWIGDSDRLSECKFRGDRGRNVGCRQGFCPGKIDDTCIFTRNGLISTIEDNIKNFLEGKAVSIEEEVELIKTSLDDVLEKEAGSIKEIESLLLENTKRLRAEKIEQIKMLQEGLLFYEHQVTDLKKQLLEGGMYIEQGTNNNWTVYTYHNNEYICSIKSDGSIELPCIQDSETQDQAMKMARLGNFKQLRLYIEHLE